MELNIQTAELALREAAESNPGAWADHSRFVAEACKNIASHFVKIYLLNRRIFSGCYTILDVMPE